MARTQGSSSSCSNSPRQKMQDGASCPASVFAVNTSARGKGRPPNALSHSHLLILRPDSDPYGSIFWRRVAGPAALPANARGDLSDCVHRGAAAVQTAAGRARPVAGAAFPGANPLSRCAQPVLLALL